MTRNTHGELLQTINDSSQDSKRALLYSFLGTSLPTEMDKSGRIKLTRTLISHAHLSKKCLIRSVDIQEEEPERLEIWSA
jgi:DNA-binding transcriptional regulator/RsmH inhibitor MraZ